MRTRSSGQAILEYILLTLMIAVTIAVMIRNTNRTILTFWTGLANQVAKPCPSCTSPSTPPDPRKDE